MSGWAKVSILGTLGADAERRATGSGKVVTRLRVAVTDTWKDQSGAKKESTVWLGAESWNNFPDWFLQKLIKGATVAITGSLRDDSYQNKDGITVSRMSVRIDELQVFPKEEFRGERRFPDNSGSIQKPSAGAVDNDEIPFAPVEDLP